MREGWETKKLGDVCENLDSKRIPITKNLRKEGSYPYYGASGIVDYVNGYIFDDDLLLVSEDGANLLARTYPIAFSISGKTWVNNHAHVLRFSSIINQLFVEYYLNSIGLNDYVSGMAQPKLNQAMLSSIELPFPPLSEQKRIVSILDKTFAAIDKAKANAEKNLQNAKELFEGYLQGVFANRGEDWEENRLKDVTTKIGSGATPRGGNESYKTAGISLIRSMNVHDRYFKEKNLAFIDDKQAKDLSNVTIQENDVLLNITGASVARCCVMPKDYLPARVNQHVSIIRPKKEILDPYFLNLLLSSKFYKDQLLLTGELGATRQAITKAQLEDFIIHYPDLKKQQTIVENSRLLSDETKKLFAIYQQKLDDLEELKKSILQKAFSGELTADTVKLYAAEQPVLSLAAEPSPTYKKVVANELTEDELLQLYFMVFNIAAHSNKPEEAFLAEVKMEKTCHFGENAIKQLHFNRRPVKAMHGPADFDRLFKLHAFADANHIFSYDKHASYKKYIEGDNFMLYFGKASAAFRSYIKDLNALLLKLLPLKTNLIDIYATAYTAWNNLLILKKPVTAKAIATEGRWHEKKNRFSDADFEKAMAFLKSNQLEPRGEGKLVTENKGD